MVDGAAKTKRWCLHDTAHHYALTFIAGLKRRALSRLTTTTTTTTATLTTTRHQTIKTKHAHTHTNTATHPDTYKQFIPYRVSLQAAHSLYARWQCKDSRRLSSYSRARSLRCRRRPRPPICALPEPLCICAYVHVYRHAGASNAHTHMFGTHFSRTYFN